MCGTSAGTGLAGRKTEKICSLDDYIADDADTDPLFLQCAELLQLSERTLVLYSDLFLCMGLYGCTGSGSAKTSETEKSDAALFYPLYCVCTGVCRDLCRMDTGTGKQHTDPSDGGQCRI